jgi:hypothetical protein
MIRNLSFLAVVIAMHAITFSAGAQNRRLPHGQLRVVDSTRIQVLTLQDGSTTIGRIKAVRGDTIDFSSSLGELSIFSGNIRAVKEGASSSMHGDEYWFPNPNSTRLFFAPTGQMLKKGEGYFADYELFFPGFAYGVTDNISIGGGVSILPLGIDEQAYYLTPKIGASLNDKLHVAGGVLFAGTKDGTGGVAYGVATLGDEDASVTVSSGYGFEGGDVASKPLVMFGGEKRVARRVALVTENYLPPTRDATFIYSFGVRFMGEKITTDLALVNASGSGIIGIPFVDFVFKF